MVGQASDSMTTFISVSLPDACLWLGPEAFFSSNHLCQEPFSLFHHSVLISLDCFCVIYSTLYNFPSLYASSLTSLVFITTAESKMKIWSQAFAAVCSVVVDSLFIAALIVGFLLLVLVLLYGTWCPF